MNSKVMTRKTERRLTVKEFQTGQTDDGEGRNGPVPRQPYVVLDNTLQGHANRLLELEADLTKTELEKRYEIGVIVRTVVADSRYGEEGVAKLARAIRRDLSTLYRAKLIVEQWPTASFEAITSKTGRGGHRLSWSHLEVLTPVSDDARRQELAEQAVVERMAVKALRSKVQPPNRRTPNASPSGSRRMIREISAAASAAQDRIERAVQVIVTDVACPEQTANDLVDVEEAMRRLNTLAEMVASALKALEGLSDSSAGNAEPGAEEATPADTQDAPPAAEATSWGRPQTSGAMAAVEGGAR